MVGWLMEHKVIVLVGLGVAAAAFFVMRSQGGSPTGSSGGIGGANPGNQTSSTDPINAQLTGLQEQLSNMMSAIAAKLGGGGALNGGPGTSGTAGTSGAPGAGSSSGAAGAAASGVSLPISVVTPLPVSAEPWQPPVAVAATAATISVAPAPASPVAGAYLGTSLGEGVYAAHVSPPATTGPGIIASLRQAILPVPVAPGPAAPGPKPKPSAGPGPGPGAFTLNSNTSNYYVRQAAAAPAPYHQAAYTPPTDAAVERSSNRSGPQ